MAAIQRAAEIVSGETVVAPRALLAETDGNNVNFPSPARALQQALMSSYAAFEDGAELDVGLWPGWARVAFLVGAASASWAIMLGGVSVLQAEST